jgi:hypothetical protein
MIVASVGFELCMSLLALEISTIGKISVPMGRNVRIEVVTSIWYLGCVLSSDQFLKSVHLISSYITLSYYLNGLYIRLSFRRFNLQSLSL